MQIAYFVTQHLRRDTGIAVLSNKRFYFGVNGGSIHFADLIAELSTHKKGEGSWTVETVHSFTDGTSNIRDIQIVRHAST